MNARIRLLMGGIAALGVVTAHGLAYALAEPDPHARHGLLEHTGHKWWTAVMAVGIGLGVVALGGLIDRWRRSSVDAAFDRRLVAVWLAVFQTGAFFGLESLERLLSGGGALSVVTEVPVVIGAVLQLALVVFEVWLLVALAAGIRYLVSRLRLDEDRARPAAFPIPVGLPAPRPLVAAGGMSRRGPPFSVG